MLLCHSLPPLPSVESAVQCLVEIFVEQEFLALPCGCAPFDPTTYREKENENENEEEEKKHKRIN